MNTYVKSIFSSVLGGIVFFIFLLYLETSFFLSVSVGIITFGGFYLLFSSIFKKNIELEVQEYSDSFYQQTMKEGYEKVKKIRFLTTRIHHTKIQKRSLLLLDIIERIFRRLEEDPKDVQSIREFFTYYLDAFYTIVEQCYRIEKQQVKGAEIDKLYEEVNKNLSLLEKFYEKQVKQLAEENILKLDSEMKMMSNMLKSEGIKDE